ncbi:MULTISPECIES: hypothetical protein [Myxococcus]|uniref:hypothetical protein n=1 Tax=Myxococcus TaxID=32 RepID=UPI00089D4CFB|nr:MULTISPECIES: hypothetical protein [Myxococcus]NOJ55836.1 hypothetical protein [Myxococcus xanthus]QPM80554.1 hypothetical protein I5Q59_04435 [Myxococcus xanthus]QVW69615.1 hypothetical protein JTM82_08725 [Myxococcus xanthus DZ2]QZZ48418.1 hypothetical protein MyxoNM_04350 [Myxococcus xanthus]UEO04257.1 hypothetical protein K1515_34085 [Myxococcus xanthus DZ2]
MKALRRRTPGAGRRKTISRRFRSARRAHGTYRARLRTRPPKKYRVRLRTARRTL